MLYDLNIPWTPTTSSDSLQRSLSFLSSLGYTTIALNHSVSSLPSQLANPIPTTQPFPLPPKINLLTRCTLTISDPSQNHRLSQLANHYDLIALRPITEKAFLAACLNLTDHSIVSLDLSIRYPFHFKPKPLMTAINRGVLFEICYAQAVMGDAERRRNVIANVMAIVRGTRGRGLVVSSGSESILGIRPPADVVNLLSVWGLARERGTEALGVNPRAVVVNEGIKRSSYRGVVELIDGGEVPERSRNVAIHSAKDPKKETLPKNGANTPSSREGTPQKNSKRKAEDANANETVGPTMSKRQAKKMRLAALKADGADSSNSSSPQPDIKNTTIMKGKS